MIGIGFRRHRAPLAGALLFLAGLVQAASEERLVVLPTRPGVTQQLLLITPEKPVASVILFSGGIGLLRLSEVNGKPVVGRGTNFLVRSRALFADHGFIVAVVDAPSDHSSHTGMDGGFRASREHAQDVEAVMHYLKQQADLPVWLVGTSRGTESAANAAIRIPQGLAGLVLTSSMTRPNRGGPDVLGMDLETIRLPVLAVAHEGDLCEYTPPQGAEEIMKRVKQAPKAEVKFLRGGDPPKSSRCEALSAHGFLGIESETVAPIAGFIKSNSFVRR